MTDGNPERRRFGNRRSHIRLDLPEAHRWNCDVNTAARVLNVSRGGMLISTRAPLKLHTVHTITTLVGGRDVRFDVRVRHVCLAVRGETDEVFEIGLEFLSAPEALDLLFADNEI